MNLTVSNWLLYGANGYTGELIAQEAVKRGLRPILAGRNGAAVAALATSLGLEYRVFRLDDPKAIDAGLKDCALVLHCAGPFSHTSKPMIDACLRTRTHYLDITGEIAVFEAAAARDLEAKAAGIMALPGVGFDVVPTDCLAATLKAQLPTATHLALAFRGLGRTSHGTTLTAVENIAHGGMIRRNGKLTPVPTAWKTRKIDFGSGPIEAVTIPWGDVSTAYYSTGIPNIEVYMAFPPSTMPWVKASRYFNWLIGSAPLQRFLRNQIDAQPRGPAVAQRARGLSHVWGEVTDDGGKRVTARLTTPNAYTLTAFTALAIVDQVWDGRAPIGFQTPAKAYGADFVFSIEGVTRLA